jgi:hypothetical protein
MSVSKITVQVTMPERETREQRLVRQRDELMDKAEHASELILADINRECALRCLRQMWAALEKKTPEHLIQLKEFIQPIILEYGSQEPDTGPRSQNAKDS